MTIKEATLADIPEIVPVLKASLGEKDLPLSEEIWNFKHVNNPFGKSLVLIAVEEGTIIGVRAFMKWQLHLGEKAYSCYRAVDTATHPKHQGKGVFKRLTLKAIDLAKEQDGNFVFNFPNEKSRPGYLKMGWKQAGKLEVAVQPSLNSFWKIKKELPENKVHYETSPQVVEKLCAEWNQKVKAKGGLHTMKSHQYLEWRFEKNPLQSYEVFASEDFYLAGCVKTRKGVRELRITECIFLNNIELSKVRKKIRQWASKFGVQFISFSPKLLSLLSIKGPIGPIMTVRAINLSERELNDFLKIKNWTYSLGDVELF